MKNAFFSSYLNSALFERLFEEQRLQDRVQLFADILQQNWRPKLTRNITEESARQQHSVYSLIMLCKMKPSSHKDEYKVSSEIR